MIDFCLNKAEIETKDVSLSFELISTFNDLLNCDLDNIIYIEDSEDEYPKIFIKNNQVKKGKRFFSKSVYFKLNNSVFEPTIIDRDNFNNCGYVFYKMNFNIKDKFVKCTLDESECKNVKDGIKCGEIYAQEGDSKIQYVCDECQSKNDANCVGDEK